MKKVLLVLKNEFIASVARPSFLITLLLVPLVGFIVMLIATSGTKQSQNILDAQQTATAPGKELSEGYIDESGLIKSLPSSLPENRLVAYSDPNRARLALEDGTISGYYIISKDYLKTGEVIYVRKDYNPLASLDQTGPISFALRYNLLNANEKLAINVDFPVNIKNQPVSPDQPQRDSGNPLTFFVPYIVMMIFYIVILMSASFMLNSITSEKQNRVIEILMVSITPTQMLTGKIIALGLVGLLQTIVWTGAGYFLLQLTGSQLSMAAGFQLPPTILIWGVVFFILGYAVYASLMAGIGALVPNLREASQATTVIIVPMIIPIMLLNALIQAPNGGLSVGLSLFPLTAPVAMMTRLAAGEVPLWQLVLAAVLLALTAMLIIRSVSGMFRAQTLLTGQSFSLKIFFKALLSKA